MTRNDTTELIIHRDLNIICTADEDDAIEREAFADWDVDMDDPVAVDEARSDYDEQRTSGYVDDGTLDIDGDVYDVAQLDADYRITDAARAVLAATAS